MLARQDGADWKFSASQISTWMACRRKWGWTYLVGIRGPTTDAQDLGKRVHKILEDYVKDGKPIDFSGPEGDIIAPGWGYVPYPKSGWQTEGEFTFKGRHSWIGYKDLQKENIVGDYKTSKDIVKYGKTEDDLLYDPQAILYAVENGAPEVELRWIYFQTSKTKKANQVKLKMLQSHAWQGFEILEEQADEAKSALLAVKTLDPEGVRKYVLSLPYNASECEAYGGCPFRGLCNLTPQERFAASMKQANFKGVHMSLFDRLKNQNAKEDTKSVATQEVKPVEVAINPPEVEAATIVADSIDYAALQAATEAKDAAAVKTRKPRTPKPVEAATVNNVHVATNGTATPPAGLTLYLDCLPMSRPPIQTHAFEDLASEARKRILDTLELADYRFAEFGKGPAIFQQIIAQLLDEGILKVNHLIVDTRVPEAIACLGLLKSRATNVIQSTK